MKVSLRQCPVCGESYGSFTTVSGARHGVMCKCDRLANAAEGLVYIVGIGFCSLVLIQFEKNMHMLQKIVDLVKSIW